MLSIFDILGPALPLVAAVLLLYAAARVAPVLGGIVRQRAHDTAATGETRRLELSIGRGQEGSPDRAVALIRAMHPQEKLGLGGCWPRGWPSFELRTVWRNGKLVWQVDAARNALRLVEVALSAAYPGVEVRDVERRDPAPVWSAVARLRKAASNPLGDRSSDGVRLLSRLAVLLESAAPFGGEVRYRVVARLDRPQGLAARAVPGVRRAVDLELRLGGHPRSHSARCRPVREVRGSGVSIGRLGPREALRASATRGRVESQADTPEPGG
jgi:hypothetical protein